MVNDSLSVASSAFVFLQSGHGTYLSATKYGRVTVQSETFDEECFKVLELDGSRPDKPLVAIKSCKHDTYLSAWPFDDGPHVRLADHVKDWEQFYMVKQPRTNRASYLIPASFPDRRLAVTEDGQVSLRRVGENEEGSDDTSMTVVDTGLPSMPSLCLDDLAAQGYCLLKSLIPEREAQEIRDVVAGLEARGLGHGSDVQRRIPELLYRHPLLAKTAVHPVVVSILRRYLGPDARCATWSSNTLFPQDGTKPCGLGWHVDFPYHDIPEAYWPPADAPPLGVQVLFALDGFTAKNGGTMFMPQSHRLMKWPTCHDEDTPPQSEILECPPGSVLIAHSAWWHRQTKNRSGKNRTALLGNYTPGLVVPKDRMELEFHTLMDSHDVLRGLTTRDKRVIERWWLGKLRRGLLKSSEDEEFYFGGSAWDLYSTRQDA